MKITLLTRKEINQAANCPLNCVGRAYLVEHEGYKFYIVECLNPEETKIEHYALIPESIIADCWDDEDVDECKSFSEALDNIEERIQHKKEQLEFENIELVQSHITLMPVNDMLEVRRIAWKYPWIFNQKQETIVNELTRTIKNIQGPII